MSTASTVDGLTRIAQSDEATARIQKILSLAFGIGALLFGVLTYGPIQQQLTSFAPWWTVMAMTFTFAVPAAMAVCARWAGRMTLRVLATIAAGGYAISMLTLWPALIGGHLAATPATPWLLEITAIGTSAAALAWRPWAVWTYTGGIAIVIVGDRILAGGPALAEIGLEDALYTLLFAAILSSLVLVTLSTGRALDRATYSARLEAAEAAALRAEQRERSRMGALMHDSILSTLLTASRSGERFREAAAQQARRALAEMDELTNPQNVPLFIDAEPFVWLLQGTTTEIAPDAFFEYDLSNQGAIRPFPRDVVDAVSEALGEGLRNSIHHAEKPEGTNRAVHVQLTDHVVRVSVLDDGPGFDTDTVPARRLGIQVSISGRLGQLEGGSGIVRSRPGVGTTVVLEWRRP